jgi:hypothetical protein
MDTRTMIRELDEVIARAHSAAEREVALLDVLPNCGLRRRKQAQVRTMRAHVDRLQTTQLTQDPKATWLAAELAMEAYNRRAPSSASPTACCGPPVGRLPRARCV